MGEVFRAFDLKLRVDVALKALLAERLSSGRARELLRQEVRSAREVVSPNVCRIFDLVPYEEILERLRSFTNLRVAADEGTDTGRSRPLPRLGEAPGAVNGGWDPQVKLEVGAHVFVGTAPALTRGLSPLSFADPA